MKKIAIQPGHVGKGGGAPEELANNKRIADRLTARLKEKGFDVYQTDYYAYNDPKVTTTDWDLFLSLHCDMDYPNDNGSGFADYPEPSTDGATTESQRIVKILNEVYFPEVKIKYVNRSNANTRFYYMWKHLTPKTPCALIEMGQSIDPHDKVLLANTDLIANALLKCIMIAFNQVETPTTNTEEENILRFLREQNANEGKVREAFGALADKPNLIKQIQTLNDKIAELQNQLTELNVKLALSEKTGADCQKSLKSANTENQRILADLAYYKPYKSLYEAALKKTIDKFSKWELFQLLFK